MWVQGIRTQVLLLAQPVLFSVLLNLVCRCLMGRSMFTRKIVLLLSLFLTISTCGFRVMLALWVRFGGVLFLSTLWNTVRGIAVGFCLKVW